MIPKNLISEEYGLMVEKTEVEKVCREKEVSFHLMWFALT